MQFTTSVNRTLASSMHASADQRRRRTIILKCSEPHWLVTRTERAIATLNLSYETVAPKDLSAAIAGADAVWLLQAGTIPQRFPAITIRPRRVPLILIAPKIPGTKQEIVAQKDAIQASNGLATEAQLPYIGACGCYMERPSDSVLRHLDAGATTFADLARRIVRHRRAVIASGLSLHWSDHLRSHCCDLKYAPRRR